MATHLFCFEKICGWLLRVTHKCSKWPRSNCSDVTFSRCSQHWQTWNWVEEEPEMPEHAMCIANVDVACAMPVHWQMMPQETSVPVIRGWLHGVADPTAGFWSKYCLVLTAEGWLMECRVAFNLQSLLSLENDWVGAFCIVPSTPYSYKVMLYFLLPQT